MKTGELLTKMLIIASKAHKGQFDKGGAPYIFHPIAVMQLLNTTHDEELLCIALGHDLIEDTQITRIELEKAKMPERVISTIELLTKIKGQTLDEYKQHIFASRDAMLVKLADLRHNCDVSRLKSLTDKDMERLQKYRLFKLEIIERLEKLKR